jgi:cytochrome c-type biogenesis protein CcmH
MILWPILAIMTCAAVFAVCWPLLRREKAVRSGTELAVYSDQLEEIGRDETAGLIGNVEAEAARVEVSRRLIAAAETASATAAVTAPARLYRFSTLIAAFILIPLGAGAIYLSLGSPKSAPAQMTAGPGGSTSAGSLENQVAQVEAYLEKNPGSGRGWEVLAPVYIRLGRFDDAVTARRNALKIFGPDASRLGNLAEALTLASRGVVTAEAKDLFGQAATADPHDAMAQYYLGLAAKQDGRRNEAEKTWRAMVANAPAGASWLPTVNYAIAHIDDAVPASDSPQVATKVAPGPSAGDVAAAAKMAPADRNEMIAAMVARLADRLAQNGSDVDGWLRLIRAYSVLGDRAKAQAAVINARQALNGAPEDLQRIGELTKELGLEGS